MKNWEIQLNKKQYEYLTKIAEDWFIDPDELIIQVIIKAEKDYKLKLNQFRARDFVNFLNGYKQCLIDNVKQFNDLEDQIKLNKWIRFCEICCDNAKEVNYAI